MVAMGQWLLAIAFLLAGAGCEKPGYMPKRYVIFVDTSASVCKDSSQAEHLLAMGNKPISKLRPGDAVEIRELNDRTLETKAVFEAETPAPGERAGLDAVTESRRQTTQIKEQAKEALRRTLNSSCVAMVTDVFSGLDRVTPDAQRRVVIIWLSDMLNSVASDLDMEKTPITSDQFEELIVKIAKRHGWHSQTLANAEVHVILPSGGIKSPNDRRVLKQFYNRLFNSLGARLVTFDTSFKTAKLS